MKSQRRKFIKDSSYLLAGMTAGTTMLASCSKKTVPMIQESSMPKVTPTPVAGPTQEQIDNMFFQISLAEWSFNRSLFGGKFTNLDFAQKTRELGIGGIEYVNQFFKDKARDTKYLNELNQRAADHGVTQVLIMVDGEGGLGSLDDAERSKAVENHHQWVDCARYLGCHAIRVNAYGQGAREDVHKAAVDGLARVAEYGAKENINVIVENHGSYSSDGKWLSSIMAEIGMENCGTLPDFGNFCIEREPGKGWAGKCINEYDKYQGVEEMMPYAKSVSAKSHSFDAQGNDKEVDFMRMMKIVKDHGYDGWVGIEFEGRDIDEVIGITKTKELLEKVGVALS